MTDVLDHPKAEADDRTAKRRSLIQNLPPGADWNEVEEAILTRRSIRRFKGRQVPADLIRRILEAARYSPSQGNCQPWSFIVIRDKSMIDEMEAYCVGVCKMLTAKLNYTSYPRGSLKRFFTRLTSRFFNRLKRNDMHPVPMSAVKLIAEGRFAVFHKAPTVILIIMDKRGVGTPEIDIGVVGTNIVLAAQSLGLGTCWIGFSKLLNRNKAMLEKLGATAPFEITEAILVGYPIGDPTNHISRQTHEISWWENGRKEILY